MTSFLTHAQNIIYYFPVFKEAANIKLITNVLTFEHHTLYKVLSQTKPFYVNLLFSDWKIWFQRRTIYCSESFENNECTIPHHIKFVKDVITTDSGILLKNLLYARMEKVFAFSESSFLIECIFKITPIALQPAFDCVSAAT